MNIVKDKRKRQHKKTTVKNKVFILAFIKKKFTPFGNMIF